MTQNRSTKCAKRRQKKIQTKLQEKSSIPLENNKKKLNFRAENTPFRQKNNNPPPLFEKKKAHF